MFNKDWEGEIQSYTVWRSVCSFRTCVCLPPKRAHMPSFPQTSINENARLTASSSRVPCAFSTLLFYWCGPSCVPVHQRRFLIHSLAVEAILLIGDTSSLSIDRTTKRNNMFAPLCSSSLVECFTSLPDNPRTRAEHLKAISPPQCLG